MFRSNHGNEVFTLDWGALYFRFYLFQEIQTAEPFVPDPSPFEVEIAIAKLKIFKSPGSD
jgi:hypothetical protein